MIHRFAETRSRTGIESTFLAHSCRPLFGSSCISRESYLLITGTNVSSVVDAAREGWINKGQTLSATEVGVGMWSPWVGMPRHVQCRAVMTLNRGRKVIKDQPHPGVRR